MLASVPWVVVLLGVVLLVGLLLVALLSFRGPERQPVPPPAPPMVLPTLAATAAVTATPSPTPTAATPTRPTATPSASSVSRTPDVLAATGPPAAAGRVTARYRAGDNDRNSFEASLLVRNGSDAARDWRVELYFSGNVKGFQASAESGISVSADGSGSYVLRGTRALGAGDTETVGLRISRIGTWDRPDQCTVNGADCAVG
ncbi:cellulose binding domain-containing protein [Micromonospora sp. NPDC049799]|uniref:cellulose binding domain-containing protein n=1 Tax=Micromonospora sp. NPDC049799 TaxID=3154741 RepID=UPI0033E0E3F4